MWTFGSTSLRHHAYALLTSKRTLKTIKNNFKKVLVLNKRTRFEIEKLMKPGYNEKELVQILRSRGSDVDTITRHHHYHKTFFDSFLKSLSLYDINVMHVSRDNLQEEFVSWADLVLVVGGDGTFLLAASHVKDNTKPVIGFNSDPSRSEGHLCLPKYYSTHFDEGLHKIFQNEFKWFFRSRIEIALTGPCVWENEIHFDDCAAPKYQQLLLQSLHKEQCREKGKDRLPQTRILPYLALNEVYLGESLSSQVSYFQIDKGPGHDLVNVKCSGLCICTGTGSTSWHLSINRLTDKKIDALMKLAGIKNYDAQTLAKKYNTSLTFDPENSMIYYSFRDLIIADVWPDPHGLMMGGLVKEFQVRSKCFNANLVIDGGSAYSFNDGTAVKLSTNPKKALRTVILD